MNTTWLAWLTTIVVVAAIGSAIALGFLSTDPLVRYRLIILLLFFAISTVSSLLFAAKANITGNLGGLTLVVGGPAALWFVAVLIFGNIYPESKIGVTSYPPDVGSLSKILTDVDERSGWLAYDKWHSLVGDYRTILGTGENTTVKNFIWYTYFGTSEQKLEAAQVDTLFVYVDQHFTVKFQRIRGQFKSDTFKLLYGSATSLQDTKSGSIILRGRHNERLEIVGGATDTGPGGSREYDVSDRDADYLIMSYYQDDNADEGDYTVIDTKRYSRDGKADVRLGYLMFNRPVNMFKLAAIKRRQVVDEQEYPISFKVDDRPPIKNTAELQSNLGEWLKAVDSEIRSGTAKSLGSPRSALSRLKDDLSIHLREVGALGANDTFDYESLFKLRNIKGQYSFSIPAASNVLLSMFLY